MFIIQEIQTTNGVPALLPAVVKPTRQEAESVFYTLCGSAVVSAVPVHTVMVYTAEGFAIPELCKCFQHDPPQATEE